MESRWEVEGHPGISLRRAAVRLGLHRLAALPRTSAGLIQLQHYCYLFMIRADDDKLDGE